MNEKYFGLKGDILEAYQDDISVGSDTPEKRIEDLRKTLKRTKEANLRIRLQKCAFGRSIAKFLGHVVTFGKIVPGDEHRNTIANFREPRSGTDLLRFLGILNFFGEFIEDSARRMKPLYDVLSVSGWNKKKKKRDRVYTSEWHIRWGSDQRKAFE
jgi:hypothetical protein